MNKPTFFDVCSGIGMGSLAAETAGFDVVGHCEIHPYCQAVLRKHWPEVPIFDDLRQLTSQSLRERGIDRVDLFAGWIPCQPASIAGQRKGASDDRWLWGEFVRLVRELRPVYLLAENPTGVLSLEVSGDDGDEQFIDWVCAALEAEGYEVQAYVIGAWAVGSPQRRDRVFIVGKLVNADYRRYDHCDGDSGGQAMAYPEGAGGQSYPGSVDDSTREGIRAQEDCGNEGRSVRFSGKPCGLRADELADTPYIGCEWPRTARDGRYGSSDCCVVNANDAGRKEQWIAVATDEGQPQLRSRRLAQSCLGGITPRSTWRLDRPIWPAGRGSEQFGYEPPRLAKGTAYRQERLMALGNMVVPECVLPFFEFIYDELTATRHVDT